MRKLLATLKMEWEAQQSGRNLCRFFLSGKKIPHGYGQPPPPPPPPPPRPRPLRARGTRGRDWGKHYGKKRKGSGERGWKKWVRPRYWTRGDGAFYALLASLGFAGVQYIGKDLPMKKMEERWDNYQEENKKCNEALMKKMEEKMEERWNNYLEESKKYNEALMKKMEEKMEERWDRYQEESKKSLDSLNDKMDSVNDKMDRSSSWWWWW